MMKAFYKCHYCGKDFTKDKEEIYTIQNLIMHLSEHDGMLHWSWAGGENEPEQMSFWFHRDCFHEMAGSEFISIKKKENKNE